MVHLVPGCAGVVHINVVRLLKIYHPLPLGTCLVPGAVLLEVVLDTVSHISFLVVLGAYQCCTSSISDENTSDGIISVGITSHGLLGLMFAVVVAFLLVQ